MSSTPAIDDTHDATLTSWVESANDPHTDFPLQNLPFGCFRRAGSDEPFRIGVAIGDQVLDLKKLHEQAGGAEATRSLLAPLAAGDLNTFMAQGPAARRELRATLSKALRDGSADAQQLKSCLVPQAQAEMALPCRVGDYTDFYTGIYHATTVGKLFRPDNPLMPNYRWVPIGYHGRSSSLQVSGHSFPRPLGQLKAADAPAPRYAASQRLDYELEIAAYIGAGNAQGTPIPMAQAEDHLFGVGLLNDWSARDVQAWEYQPLGPFLAKSFASTVSPWIVTMEALAPFRTPFERAEGDPQPLPYLDSPVNRAQGGVDITLEVWMQTAQMRERGEPATRLMQSNYQDAYWTLAQMVAHHASNGCNLQPGDLLGTGTQSGPEAGQGGSLLELSQGGKQPLKLPNGQTRTFIEDGDTIIMRGFCERSGARRIGFGDCMGSVRPAVAMSV